LKQHTPLLLVTVELILITGKIVQLARLLWLLVVVAVVLRVNLGKMAALAVVAVQSDPLEILLAEQEFLDKVLLEAKAAQTL
jgi:hypothetical protein